MQITNLKTNNMSNTKSYITPNPLQLKYGITNKNLIKLYRYQQMLSQPITDAIKAEILEYLQGFIPAWLYIDLGQSTGYIGLTLTPDQFNQVPHIWDTISKIDDMLGDILAGDILEFSVNFAAHNDDMVFHINFHYDN